MPCTTVASKTETTRIGRSATRCLATTSSIRGFVEYGRTNPATLLITISTKPNASRPRRGRINVQTSGQTAFSRWRFGGFFASLICAEGLNLQLDSAGLGFASLLLHCHTSADGAPAPTAL